MSSIHAALRFFVRWCQLQQQALRRPQHKYKPKCSLILSYLWSLDWHFVLTFQTTHVYQQPGSFIAAAASSRGAPIARKHAHIDV